MGRPALSAAHTFGRLLYYVRRSKYFVTPPFPPDQVGEAREKAATIVGEASVKASAAVGDARDKVRVAVGSCREK